MNVIITLFQVRVGGNRGFLDGTLEFGNWLKYVRSTDNPDEITVRPVLSAGQVRTISYVYTYFLKLQVGTAQCLKFSIHAPFFHVNKLHT